MNGKKPAIGKVFGTIAAMIAYIATGLFLVGTVFGGLICFSLTPMLKKPDQKKNAIIDNGFTDWTEVD